VTQLVYIDTETGGLDPAKHAILEVALVTRIGNVQRTFSRLIREPGLEMGESITEKALEVNGLTLTQIRSDGRNVSEVAVQAAGWLQDVAKEAGVGSVCLAGQNVPFDIGFLRRLFTKAGTSFPQVVGHRSFDLASIGEALVLAGRLPREVVKEGRTLTAPGLEAVQAHLGIAVDTIGPDAASLRPHRALYDALLHQAVGDAYIELLRKN